MTTTFVAVFVSLRLVRCQVVCRRRKRRRRRRRKKRRMRRKRRRTYFSVDNHHQCKSVRPLKFTESRARSHFCLLLGKKEAKR
jgi:hypothetical protein